jgi:hypothetical protein
MAGLAERCLDVLEGSWSAGERDGVKFAYTRPSPGRYRWRWYWDSCFAAIAWRLTVGDPALEPRIVAHHAALTAARDLARHLFDERRFWAEVPVPSVALDEPSFSLKEHFDGLRRYWRGPTWIKSAWLLWLGIMRLGYEEQAATLARAITETVVRGTRR